MAAAALPVRRRRVTNGCHCYHYCYSGFTTVTTSLIIIATTLQNTWSWSSSLSSLPLSHHQHYSSRSSTRFRINNNHFFLVGSVDDNANRRRGRRERKTTMSWRRRFQTDTSTSLFSQCGDNNEESSSSFSSSSLSSSSSSKTLSYDDTDSGSKGLVGGLTAIINLLSSNDSSRSSSSSNSRMDAVTDSTRTDTDEEPTSQSSQSQSTSQSMSQSDNLLLRRQQTQKAALASRSPPTSSGELLERLRRDYIQRNYLWTGNLDIDCFEDDCQFTDPTISFVGTDAYTTNTQNLIPLVEAFVTLKEDGEQPTSATTTTTTGKKGESILLSIKDYPEDGYIETRWNMVGTLDKNPWLFWKPTIDVIGRTKFWYRKQRQKQQMQTQNRSNNSDDDDDDNVIYQVWFYDEEWEIPAYKALLQLISPTSR